MRAVRAARALLAAAALGLACPARAQEEAAGGARPGLLAMGGLLLYSDVRAPLSLVTLPVKPKDAVDVGEVTTRSCQHGLAIPIAASLRPTTISGASGNGGFDRALADLRRQRADLAGIYDVRIDARTLSILGFYRRLCIEITARGYRL